MYFDERLAGRRSNRSGVARRCFALAATLALTTAGAACGGGDGGAPDILPEDAVCPPMFAQNLFPTYHVELDAGEWAALQDEFVHREEREAAGMDPTPYHPVRFTYVAEDQEVADVPNVLIRLKVA